jgi:hypothetical protein
MRGMTMNTCTTVYVPGWWEGSTSLWTHARLAVRSLSSISQVWSMV